jgi:predicted ArsR family transcriptional regulator
MTEHLINALDRRSFVTRVMPVCSLACLAVGSPGARDASDRDQDADLHKFDIPFEQTMTQRQRIGQQYDALIRFIKSLQSQMSEDELVRLLEAYSADYGREVGKLHASQTPDTTFASFVANFRPPNYKDTLTLEIVEDTDTVFQLRVTECVWARVFQDAGLGGRIGFATVCNMDFTWPQAFNERFRMERDKTLMQGHDQCNHRYVDTG